MKSPIKWTGGKAQLVDVLMPLVTERLAEGGTYWEPFLGGGAMALAMPEHVMVVGNDVNHELVEMWDSVRRETHQLSVALRRLAASHSESFYYSVRAGGYESRVDRAARFIYLNKMGFNGLYRKNQKGQFNVPLGRGKVSQIPAYSQLVEVGHRLRSSWRLESLDFEQLLEDPAHRPTEGDVIFADPPYYGTHAYSSGWTVDDQRRLSACLRRCARRGVGVVATNSDTLYTRDLYRWADVRGLDEKRRIRADVSPGTAACIVAVRP